MVSKSKSIRVVIDLWINRTQQSFGHSPLFIWRFKLNKLSIRQYTNTLPDKRNAKAFDTIYGRTFPSRLDTAITAHAGGGQASAIQLNVNASYHEVTIAASVADSVKLPPATEGEFHWVKNSTTVPIQVFGSGTDTINSVATATGVVHPQGLGLIYVCLIPGNYIQFGFGAALADNNVVGALNATGSLTAALIAGGAITSTSAAAVTMTTVTATAIAAAIGATTGSMYDFAIDNSAGANTVTLALDASITAPVGAVTGGNTLTITTTHKVGVFRLYFTSPTAAVIYRIA